MQTAKTVPSNKLVLVGIRDPMYRRIVLGAVHDLLPNNEVFGCERINRSGIELLRRMYPAPILVADEYVLSRFRNPQRHEPKHWILGADTSPGSDFSQIIVCVSTERRCAELVNFGSAVCRFSSFAEDFSCRLGRKAPSQVSS